MTCKECALVRLSGEEQLVKHFTVELARFRLMCVPSFTLARCSALAGPIDAR